MKVYGVCVQCSDDYYGYNPPRKMFSTKEKAEQYLKDKFKNKGELVFKEDDYYGIRVEGYVYDYIIKKYIVK